MRVFHTRKLRDLMSDAGVDSYQELAALSNISEATIRKARREGIGVPRETAMSIVRKLLKKKVFI